MAGGRDRAGSRKTRAAEIAAPSAVPRVIFPPMRGTRGEFKVSVRKEDLVFAAAHFITLPGHRCESLHGHNYRTAVEINGGLEPEAWYVYDFVALKQLMRRLTNELDHKVLLPTTNPSVAVQEQPTTTTVSSTAFNATAFPLVTVCCSPSPTRRSRCWPSISRAGCETR